MKISREEEKTLITKSLAGDEFAFAQLTLTLREKVFWRALKAVGDRDEAEDIVNDVGQAVLGKMTEEEVLKEYENKLQKYNNIFDKLRKKRDILVSLTTQKKFLVHFNNLK